MKIAILSLFLILTGCTNSDDAIKSLNSAGFDNISITGYGWFACSEDDWFHTKFIATNSNGQTVTGVVCSGLLFKNSTIRF